ncbi:short-chain fatty acid transporter [Rubrobacter taiwanensis]|jgi:short-chain fatty acids transporter|uniref:Short-chain fatty acid transporter n=1 Tax=Rubrobacter taiwanensis TaxID=185139 RepID=A0A4R1B717_9ACTN|nr:TIGR00366 family protein [Rubrobacter taiwanensis]TCJ12208.1 short-chain fatty acid transporter [Rubrobacter taiwanensis]
MLRALARPMVRIVERWLPDSLVFAIILTFVVAAMSLTLTDSGPVEVLRGWGDGLAGLLEFIAQISIVLVLGYTLANTGPVRRLLRRISRVPRSPAAAYGFVTLVAGIASLISWGIGLIVGGIMAVQVAQAARERGIRLHYPLLVACAYSGFVVWHMGYSGSGPLAAATPGSFFEDLAPLVPVTQTILAWWNILAIVLVLAAVITSMVLLTPRGDDPIVELGEGQNPLGDPLGRETAEVAPVADSPEDGRGEDKPGEKTLAQRLDGARVITLSIGLALAAYLAVYFAQEGLALTLDIVNWSFLAVIMLVVGSSAQLVKIISEAGKTVGQILLQYPLYAGILGMMTATGLVEVLSSFFVSISTPQTLGIFTMLFAGLINMFVPSGGGQFAVQAPIFVDAADRLGVSHEVVIMAIAYGDQWTNMIQPFWAIPLLAVAGLGIRDILGYTTITLLVSGIVFGGVLLFLGPG